MKCVSGVKSDFEISACPSERRKDPRLNVLSKNCTVPVGVGYPGRVDVTVAERLTGWFNLDGLNEDVNVTRVPPMLGSTTIVFVAAIKSGSPPLSRSAAVNDNAPPPAV
jgi:hypothetical protein